MEINRDFWTVKIDPGKVQTRLLDGHLGDELIIIPVRDIAMCMRLAQRAKFFAQNIIWVRTCKQESIKTVAVLLIEIFEVFRG